MSADAQMQYLGELDGKPCYWAAPGRFEKPGFYYWNGQDNVYVPLAQPVSEQEPVGEIVIFGTDLKEVSWKKGKMPSPGTKLFAAPPVADSQDAVHKSLSASVADALRPFLGEGQKVIWREPFRWRDDAGVLPNHYEMFSPEGLAADFGYTIIENCGCAAIIDPRPTSKDAAMGVQEGSKA